MTDAAIPRPGFPRPSRKFLLGCLAVIAFFVAWQAAFLVVPYNELFITKPTLMFAALWRLTKSGQLFFDLGASAAPFAYGLIGAVVVGVPLGIVMGWRQRVGQALDPLMTALYASPLVALAPLVVIFLGVGVGGKAFIVFLLTIFDFMFNAYAGVRSVDPLLLNVVRSFGGKEKDLYVKIIFPSVIPYIVAGARIGVGRALIGVLIGEFFAASEGIGYGIVRFGNFFALDSMFAYILVVTLIAVALTQGIRWAERTAFPWRIG
ncbi:MAG TPA: ABC transporter permease [Stellaceae bacterium]|jgi:NitT/TauT family transport system permease protein|nr:ABC transporter permease [Stellaceae bacterium]